MGLNVQYLLFLSDFNNCSIFSTDLQKILKTSFIKIHPVAVQLFHADTRTNESTEKHNEVIGPFSQCVVNF